MSRNDKTRKRKRREARKKRQEQPTLHDIGQDWTETDYPIHSLDRGGPVRTVETTGEMEGDEFRVDSWREVEGPDDYQE